MIPIVCLLAAGSVLGPGQPVSTEEWSFLGESVVVRVEMDEFSVEATYEFGHVKGAASLPVLYPFPEGPDLGPVWVERVVLRYPDGMEFEPDCHTERAAIRFVLPAGSGDRCWIDVRYTQTTQGGHARYILVSARRWSRPIGHAELTVEVPEDWGVTIRPAMSESACERGWRRFGVIFDDWIPGEDLVVQRRQALD